MEAAAVDRQLLLLITETIQMLVEAVVLVVLQVVKVTGLWGHPKQAVRVVA